MSDLTDRDNWTWEMAMADTTPPLLTESKLFWLALGRYEQPIAKAA